MCHPVYLADTFIYTALKPSSNVDYFIIVPFQIDLVCAIDG